MPRHMEKGAGREIVNGIGIGFFFAVLLSLYIANFTNISLPIWLIYGILAPLISAIAIAILVYSGKERRSRTDVKYWDITQKKEKEREARM